MTTYKFSFVSTTQDLLEAHEAHRTAASGMRPVFRWAVIAMGVVWVLGAVLAWGSVDQWWLPLIWLLLGSGILWRYVLKPSRVRRNIQESNSPSQPVELVFDTHRMTIDAAGVGRFEREWTELAGVRNTRMGILVYFTDGIVNWLPNRLFRNEAEKASLCSFVEERSRAAR